MPEFLITIPVFLPILAGALLLVIPNIKGKSRNIYTLAISILNLALVIAVSVSGKKFDFTLFNILENVNIAFGTDGLGKVFAVLVSVLWPLSLLYGYEYMEDEERQGIFFAFFTMTLGSVIGIAFARDLFTMYLFYEILSLLTFPLVMHTMTEEAMKVGRLYLVYMLGGAAFAFVGIIIVMQQASTLDFTMGGVIIDGNITKAVLVFVFFMMFCGFSVKAAMMPFGNWLIKAAVAPMPVTGLLHAVAVVKAGAFAVLRLIYYVFGAEYLRGTWAQYACICLTAVTILYGSVMAVREQHLKRRLAYSTLSNLSYILFGACIMTPLGMLGSMTHLITHAVTKIALFFCVGAIMHVTGKNYVYEIDGLGKKMKLIFAFFAIASCSLIGVPQFSGFISKMRLLNAALDADHPYAYIGAFAIVISALLTAVYLLTVVIRAYFPKDNKVCENYDKCHDPGLKMLLPIGITATASLVLGIFWEPIANVLKVIAFSAK